MSVTEPPDDAPMLACMPSPVASKSHAQRSHPFTNYPAASGYCAACALPLGNWRHVECAA